jgi:hypothetical protein
MVVSMGNKIQQATTATKLVTGRRRAAEGCTVGRKSKELVARRRLGSVAGSGK